MRFFYAVKVPTHLAVTLAAAQRGLRGNWRAVREDQLHVTLAYLPDVQESDLGHLREVGRKAARNLAPFTVNLRGTGYFPNEGSPRVWFVKVEAPELDDLAARLREQVRVAQDDKPFRAHVTLARKKGPAPRVPPIVYDLGWQVTRFDLVKSVLHKSGPEYETVAHFGLKHSALQDGASRPQATTSQAITSPQEAPHDTR